MKGRGYGEAQSPRWSARTSRGTGLRFPVYPVTAPAGTVGVLEDETFEIPRPGKEEGTLRPQEAGPPLQGLGS